MTSWLGWHPAGVTISTSVHIFGLVNMPQAPKGILNGLFAGSSQSNTSWVSVCHRYEKFGSNVRRRYSKKANRIFGQLILMVARNYYQWVLFFTSIEIFLGKKCSACKALYLRCLYVIVLGSHEALYNDEAELKNNMGWWKLFLAYALKFSKLWIEWKGPGTTQFSPKLFEPVPGSRTG